VQPGTLANIAGNVGSLATGVGSMIAGGITGGASYLGWKGSSTPSKNDPYSNNSGGYGNDSSSYGGGGSYYNPPSGMALNENDSIQKQNS
jgi:hypothetical protein